MANDLSNITPLLLKRALLALRQNSILPRLVNVTYSPEAGELGSPIQVPVPKPSTAYSITAGTPGTASNISPNKVTITTDQWYGVSFELSDKEITEAASGTIPMQMSENIKALANNVDNAILTAALNGVGSIYGTASAPDDKDDITALVEKLDNTLAPMDNRVLVIDAATKRQFLEIASTTGSDVRGDGMSEAIVAARLANTYGFEIFMDQNVNGKSHTSGTIGTHATDANNEAAVNGALAAGATSMAIDGAVLTTGTITKGTAFVFDSISPTQEFVVTADVTLSGGAGTVSFFPQLPVAVANDVNVQFYKSYTLNGLAFHPQAIALAVRPFAPVSTGLGSIVEQDVDPISQLPLRLEVTRSAKVTRFELDILYGLAVVRPEYAVKLATYTGTGSNPV